ncbi:hypothetical protein Ae150APs1_6158 [Pseudonocardia sp. Ae150A_Ps1]|nr:hypothetical protein Ae150APs1_6108 [Pseudonocardia sp. Ae150A_Ps1]OLL70070.1 hypothetical protein Ae150APs1_6158 [Pseudonocardia sp. Ae150A_Ps1]
MRLDVGDVGDPQPVRGRRGEVALDQVRAQVGAVGTDGGPRHPLPPDTAQACGFHEPADGAPRDRPVVHAAFAAQLCPDFPDAVDAVVLGVHACDLGGDEDVAFRPGRGWTGLRRIVGTRGDRDTGVFQHGTDRPDPELVPVLVDVVGDYRCGRSSSAAKKAEADLRMMLARRSSRVSRSSSASRAA